MKEQRLVRGIWIPSTILLACFCIVPFLYMVVVSLLRSPEDFIYGFGAGPSLSNYVSVFSTSSLHFGRYLLNSMAIAGLSSIISVAVAALAAYGVTRVRYRRKVLILMGVLCLSMFPQISQVGFLYEMTTRLGWINTYRGLVLPYVAWILPLSFWFLTSYFSRIPLDLDRAALIDGCSRLSALFRVVLPVAMPGLVSTLLLAFIFGYNEFLFALLLTSDEAARTLPVGIALFEGLHGQIPWGTVMAASTVATVPVVLLVIFFQRRIVEGLTRGALKA